METVSVIGAGSWGTAVARHLVMNGHVVRLWSHSAEAARLINERRENPRYLPGCVLPDGVTAFTDLSQALDGAAAAVLVVPSGNLRHVERVGEPRHIMIALGREKDLRFVLQSPERFGINYPVPVALIIGTHRARLFVFLPPLRFIRKRGERREKLFFF